MNRESCRLPADCHRIICGLACGRSLEYMIFVEVYRRLGCPLDEAQRERLTVRAVNQTKKLFELRGCVDAAYLGTVACHLDGLLYICRIQPNASAGTHGQAVLIPDVDEVAALPRSIEL